jgi:hypothetical protein
MTVLAGNFNAKCGKSTLTSTNEMISHAASANDEV